MNHGFFIRNNPMKQKKWCAHISWRKEVKGMLCVIRGGWVFNIDPLSSIAKSWKLCPICGAKRPKGE